MKEMLAKSVVFAVFLGLIIFPVIYATYYKLRRRILFVAACYGLEQIITVLLFGLVSPLILLNIFMFPQLEANNSIEGIRWLIDIMRIFQDYWYLGTPIVLFIVPFLIHRKYQGVFVIK